MLEFALPGYVGSIVVTLEGQMVLPAGIEANRWLDFSVDGPPLILYAGASGLTSLSSYTQLVLTSPSSGTEFLKTVTVKARGVAHSLYVAWNPDLSQGNYGLEIWRVAAVGESLTLRAQPGTRRSHFS